MKTCESCCARVEVLHRMPLMNLCTDCYKQSKANWRSETPERKEEIRRELRKMGIPSPDEVI
tara:strand:- start:1400 stop:1585 length:186 start_codon:yes stop_codon:yes gene_type:complete